MDKARYSQEPAELVAGNLICLNGPFADLYRSFDWSNTALGDLSTWPDILISSVNTILAAPIPMQLFWGVNGVCLYNEAMRPHLSTKHPLSLGQPASEVWKEAWEVIGPQIQCVLSTGFSYSFSDIFLPLLRDGKMVDQYWTYSYSPVFDSKGQIVGVLDVAQETTEKVQALEAERRSRKILERSEDRFRVLIERAGIGINIGDAGGNLTYINPALLELIGYSKQDVERGELRWRDLTPPEFASADSEAIRQLAEKGVAAPYEKVYMAKDGRRIPVLLSAAMIPSMSDNISKEDIAVFFTDLTYQKRAEATVLQTEKLAAVGRLASTIAHEINNPLEAVTNLLYLARQNAVKPDVKGWLDQADSELRRMSAIAQQTLRFHRQSSAPKAVSCTNLFSSTLDLYEARLRNSGIVVEKRKRANEPVLCFEGDIRQVLSNIVTNSLDAMSGGGRLLVRSREGTDWRTGRRGLLLTVADTGMGIPVEARDKVFEAFYTTKGIGGSGLGLWISADIVARHHGRLLLRSSNRKECHGTTVSLFLPFGE